MLDLVASIIFGVLNGVFWYSPTVGFGKVWASNAWPGKTLEQIGETQTEGMLAACILSNVMAIVLFRVLVR